MSILRTPRTRETRSTESSLVLEALRNRRRPGVSMSVDTDTALKVPAVAACVQTIAGAISSLTLEGYRDEESGQAIPLANLPRLWREPSAEESAEDWFYKVIQAAMCDGRAWGRIVSRDARMSPTQIELVPDEAVTVKAGQDGMWEFSVDRKPVPAADMWWFPGVPARTHPFGASLVQRASEPITVQLAALRYLRDWFRDGAHPTAIIQAETDPGQELADRIKQRVRDLTSGNREPLVLPSSMSLNPFQSAPADSAIGDVMTTTATQIAMFFLVPPELAGGSAASSMTYQNVEQQQIIVLQRAVRYWMVKLEKSLSRLVRPAAIYAKFDENDLVRTDLKSKFDAIIAATGGPFLTVDEGREMDDRAPLPGGDVLRSQQPAPQMIARVDEQFAEMRGLLSHREPAVIPPQQLSFDINMPEQKYAVTIPVTNEVNVPEARIEAPVVNNTINVEPTPFTNEVRVDVPPAPEQRTPDVVVNVTNDVQPAAVNVNPQVTAVLQEQPTIKRVSYDGRGRVSEITEEPM